jgi:hypothetical protein
MVDFAGMMFRPITDRMKTAKWTDGKTTLNGWWEYNWQSDSFFIILEKTRGHAERRFRTHNDTPEWGKYKLEGETCSKK